MSDSETQNRLARWDALLGISAERDAIAEVERLRVINADLRMMVDGLENAAHQERVAVVAWLRERAAAAERRDISVAASILEEASDTIERGEHRREEER